MVVWDGDSKQGLRAVSLFSGVGGFEVGFERAGIQTVLQAEKDPWALQVLARHWPGTERVSDVRSVVGGAWLRSVVRARDGAAGDDAQSRSGACVDLVYGGFPCQDLSVAGKRAGLGGERSGLWFEFYRVVSELRPRWAVVENVPGLLSSNEGRDFAVILDGLGELGFSVGWAVLDAQHFGVPQRRRRVFVVAGPSRRSVEQVLSLCESCGGNPETGRTAWEGTPVAPALRASGVGTDRVGDTRGQDPLVTAIEDFRGKQSGGAEVGLGIADDTMFTLQANGHEHAVAIRTANTGANGHGVAEDVAHTLDGANGQAIHVPEIVGQAVSAKWAKGSSGPSGPSGDEVQNMVSLAQGVRRLTPLECERLMGWPDDWTRWTADGREISDSHRYRMCGNGVVSTVSEWIGHRLVAMDRGLLQVEEQQ